MICFQSISKSCLSADRNLKAIVQANVKSSSFAKASIKYFFDRGIYLGLFKWSIAKFNFYLR